MTVWTRAPDGTMRPLLVGDPGGFLYQMWTSTTDPGGGTTQPSIPANYIDGTTEMNAVNQAPIINQRIRNAAAGSTVTLARGIHMVDLSPSGQLEVGILLRSNVDLDFSQAEIRLRPGQSTIRDRDGAGAPIPGTTSTQWGDIITNQNVAGSNLPITGVTVRVGCLNGRAAGNRGTYTGTNPDLDNGCFYDGIVIKSGSNCVIEGGINTPWGRGPTQSDGQPLYRGVIKNVRAWDGSGGDTESFHYSFDGCNGTTAVPLIARRLEVKIDDGSTRSATGGSSNTGQHILHEDIRSKNVRAQAMTSWRSSFVTYRRVNSGPTGGACFRNEEGYGHRNIDCWAHDAAGNGYNIKGAPAGQGAYPANILTVTGMLMTGTMNNAFQINSLTNPFTATGRYEVGITELSAVTQIGSPPRQNAPGNNLTNFVQIADGSWTPPLPD